MHQAFYLRRLTMEFNQKQIAQLQKAGISKDYLSAQKHMLLKGAKGIELDRAASIGDGIHALSEREQEVMIQLFEATAPEWKIIRFVPASGAATRMFKHLIAKDEPAQSVFLEGLDKMAISEDIPKEILSGEGDTKGACAVHACRSGTGRVDCGSSEGGETTPAARPPGGQKAFA